MSSPRRSAMSAMAGRGIREVRRTASLAQAHSIGVPLRRKSLAWAAASLTSACRCSAAGAGGGGGDQAGGPGGSLDSEGKQVGTRGRSERSRYQAQTWCAERRAFGLVPGPVCAVGRGSTGCGGWRRPRSVARSSGWVRIRSTSAWARAAVCRQGVVAGQVQVKLSSAGSGTIVTPPVWPESAGHSGSGSSVPLESGCGVAARRAAAWSGVRIGRVIAVWSSAPVLRAGTRPKTRPGEIRRFSMPRSSRSARPARRTSGSAMAVSAAAPKRSAHRPGWFIVSFPGRSAHRFLRR